MLIPFFNRLLHWFVVGTGSTVMSLLMLSKGCTMETLGLVVALYSVFIVLFEFPSGVLSDTIGQKKIYLMSIGLSIVGYSIILFNNGQIWLIAGFSCYGIARAFSSGSVEALFVNQYIGKHGKQNLHKLMSVLNSGEVIGLATGALTGGLIPIAWSNWFPGRNKYHGNLVLQLLDLAVLFAFTLVAVREPDGQTRKNIRIVEHTRESLKAVRDSKTLSLLVLGTLIWGFCFNAIELYWQPRVREILGNDSRTWIFGLINGGYFLASLLGVGLVNIILRRRNVSHLVLLAVSRISAGILVMILASRRGIIEFTSIYLFMFMINGMMNIPESTIMNTMVPDGKRSSVLSLASLAMQSGGIAGAIVYSMAVKSLGVSGVWLIAGAVFGLSGIIYVAMPRHDIMCDR